MPGIQSTFLAMDTEEGVEVVWNELLFTDKKAFKAHEVRPREPPQLPGRAQPGGTGSCPLALRLPWLLPQRELLWASHQCPWAPPDLGGVLPHPRSFCMPGPSS